MPSMGDAPLRPSIRPSQYSSTVFPSGFTVPIPVTTTRRSPLLLKSLPPGGPSAAHSLPNLTGELCFHRLLGDADGVLDGPRVRATVGHHRDAVDPQQRSATELAPVQPCADLADGGADQEASQLAPDRAGDLLAKRLEDEVGGRL